MSQPAPKESALSVQEGVPMPPRMNPHRFSGRKRQGEVDPERLLAGDVSTLSRAISLVESDRLADEPAIARLLDACAPSLGRAIRVGISGSPGVGKSTLIERLGSFWLARGDRLAVLTIDPSSQRSGGSILGDQSRMPGLVAHPAAFLRATAARKSLGGVAARTREAILLCEAAGFTKVIVETVGVGQSEVEVGDLVDVFLLLAQPGAGDELQGVKRGIMEMADVIAVTKADGALRDSAQLAAAQLAHVVPLLGQRDDGWLPTVGMVSSLQGFGIAELDQRINEYLDHVRRNGALEAKRAHQRVAWYEAEVTRRSLRHLQSPEVESEWLSLAEEVSQGKRSPWTAAEEGCRKWLA